MVVLRFRNKEEHKDLLKKVKKMKEYAEMIEDCLEEMTDDEDIEFRRGSYRRDEDEEMDMRGGRYRYRSGGGRM